MCAFAHKFRHRILHANAPIFEIQSPFICAHKSKFSYEEQGDGCACVYNYDEDILVRFCCSSISLYIYILDSDKYFMRCMSANETNAPFCLLETVKSSKRFQTLRHRVSDSECTTSTCLCANGAHRIYDKVFNSITVSIHNRAILLLCGCVRRDVRRISTDIGEIARHYV